MEYQLPSTDEIYDFTTDQLSKLKDQINGKISKSTNYKNYDEQLTEQIQKLKQLLQTIELEIQERKTIQYFTQLCINDGTANKYVKEITDFNNQFKKLANQLIENKSIIQQNLQDEQQSINNKNDQRRLSYTSIASKSQKSETQTNNTIQKQNNKAIRTQNSQFSYTSSDSADINSKGRQTSTKKMGLGGANMKKKKNDIADFIKATLSKTKAVEYVSGKGNLFTKSPQKNVNGSSRITSQTNVSSTPISTNKSIKSVQQVQSIKKVDNKIQANNSSKVISGSQKSIQSNREAAVKKRNEAIQKVKGLKKVDNFSASNPPKPVKKQAKGIAGLDPKSLVQLVKLQEQAKRKRQQQTPITKQQKIEKQKQKKLDKQTFKEQGDKNVDDRQTEHSFPIQQKIEIQGSRSPLKTEAQYQIKEQIHPIVSSDTQSDTESANKPKGKIIKESGYTTILQEQIEESIVFQKLKQKAQVKGQKQVFPEKDQKINQIPETNLPQQHSQKPQSYQTPQVFGKITVQDYNPDYTQKDDENIGAQEIEVIDDKVDKVQKIEEIVNQHKGNEQTKETKKTKNGDKTKNSQKIKKPQDQMIVLPGVEQLQKKCYNEQYWQYIKQQAQAKIQRFRQQQQLQRKQRQYKDRLLEQQKKRLRQQLQGNRVYDTQKDKQKQIELKQDQLNDDNDKFIQGQKENLKKIYQKNNINGSRKVAKPAVSMPKVIKPSYPKPEFNYLQIYPSFEHVFNVFHTKSQNQAIQDIPSIMREMILMFTDHINYFKNKTNNFRPAIFLPFDNRKSNCFADARQLLQHAETTHVNLKTLVERLQIFNSNVQGEFQNATEIEKNNTQYYRVVKTKEEVYDIITTGFLRRKGWKQLPHGQNLKANWNLFWSWSKPQIDMNKLLVFQKVNHFPFNKNLSRKDLLYKNIDFFRKTHKVSFPYLPLTFNLPKQFSQFSKKFHEQELVNRDRNYWIMKPIGKSRGRGIKLINSLGDLNYLDNIVVQKYIANPLLIDGYKFDMRIYVLVTNFHPLEAFVYKQGFARLSTEKYSLEPGDMKNNFVHLTNFAINKHNLEGAEQFSGGSKISLKSLKEKITKMGYSFQSVWSQVNEIVIKSLLACSVSVPPFPGAFELFGYDVMLDQDCQCHLIQINASPSLQRSFLIDEIIKQSLIDDIIQIVNPPKFSKEQIINVMNERLSPDFRNVKKGQLKQQDIQEEDLIHLARILKYQKLRKLGEMPEKIGLFEMIAPSQASKQLQKVIKSKSGINNPHNID